MDLAIFFTFSHTFKFSATMVFHYISPNVKLAAVKIYENNLINLDDILACLNMSKSTLFYTLQLYWETSNVEHPKSTTHGRPWRLHFDDLTYIKITVLTGSWMNYFSFLIQTGLLQYISQLSIESWSNLGFFLKKL